MLAEMRHDFQEVRRGFWKAGWTEVDRKAYKSRKLKTDCEDLPLLGTLVAGCPGQAWGKLISLGSHCHGCYGLVLRQKVQKSWQE